ncbi:hypothetical protein KPH14_011544 [Odynerus spinipes]|uniref:Odorant receptor n=1 Tax=Odynerus spinipes TaxID=1348599 RepID=A0AAD9RJI5_9HYME|nr:hypothetical protein KPH14_011544 [Odynerus spinipes]
MEALVIRYYNLNRFLLSLTGLWPFQNKIVKYLIIRLCHNWDLLFYEKEHEIMQEYALKVLICSLIIILVIWTSFLWIYDVIAPLNGSHHAKPPFSAEYFIDEEVYFYHILMHMYLIFIIGMAVFIALETFYAVCVQHACGLFYIVGYRFEEALNESVLNLPPFAKKSFDIFEKIARAIEAHKNAIEFVDHMNSCFSKSYFVLLILVIAAVTVNSTAVLQAITAARTYDAANNLARIINITCGLFCLCYCGQKLIDCSTSISKKVYNLPWFLAPVEIQGSLLVVMQRSLKECTLVLGTLFPVSFELFAAVLKMSSYYITTLRALQ